MKSPTALHRLLALRRLQEETREVVLLARRRQYRSHATSLEEIAPQRSAAMLQWSGEDASNSTRAAALDLRLLQVRRERLANLLPELQAAVESAHSAWLGKRRERMQVESVLQHEQERLHRELSCREQKRLDGWYLAGWRGAEAEKDGSPDE